MSSRGANFCGKISHIPWYDASLQNCDRYFSQGLSMLVRLLFLSFLFYVFQTIRMDWPEKRPHVVTGNTPNKPREKRARDGNASETCDQRPARRTLAFQGKGSPLQQVLWYISIFSQFEKYKFNRISFLRRVEDFSKEQDLSVRPKALSNWFPLRKEKQWPFLGRRAKWLHWCNLLRCTVNSRLASGQHLEPNMNTGTKLRSSSRKLWEHLIREAVSFCFPLSYRI